MITLSKIIYNLKNMQNFGRHSDDLKLGNRQLEFIIDHFRAEIAAQRQNQKKSVDGFKQHLKVEMVSATEVDPIDPLVDALQSKDHLPAFVVGHNGRIITHVGPNDLFFKFQATDMSTYNIDLSHELSSNYYLVHHGKLYVFTKTLTLGKYMPVEGVFASPRTAIDYESPTPLSGYDWEYPIPGNLINQLNNLIVHNEFRWREILPADLINDGTDAQ